MDWVTTASTTIEPSVGPTTAMGVVRVGSAGSTGIRSSARWARRYAGMRMTLAPTQASGLLHTTPTSPKMWPRMTAAPTRIASSTSPVTVGMTVLPRPCRVPRRMNSTPSAV